MINICPLTNDKEEILDDLLNLKSSSKLILDSIQEIKDNLEKDNCDTRKLSEKHVKQLRELKNLYEQFKSETYTSTTNKKLKDIFNSNNSDVNKLSEYLSYSKLIILLENKKLKDNYIYSESSFRDNVEANINLIGEYYETEEINIFYHLFTIEYINLLDRENIKYPNLENSKLKINRLQLEEIILKVQKRQTNNATFDYNIEFNLIGSKEKIQIKNLKQIYEKQILIQQANEKIKELEEMVNRKNKIEQTLTNSKNIEDLESNNENNSISILFRKYFGDNKVNNRGDINGVKFNEILYNLIYDGKITQFQRQKILEHGYYLAFKSEIKSNDGKKGIENIKRYEKEWREIFGEELNGIIKSRKKAESLFLLSWVEGNGVDQSKNSFGAIGWFQILLSTAKIVDPKATEDDLHDPIRSAKIAAKYMKILILEEKKENDDLSDDDLITKAITKYNGNFSSRLKKAKRENVDNTIYKLFKDLNWIRVIINKKNNNYSINKIKDDLDKVHDRYFINSGDGNGEFKGESHFGILEKPNVSKQEINKWIKNYIKNVLKQQNMYPVQFNAISKLYPEL